MAFLQFHIDQKIFAKVIVGYPPWPGKICDFYLDADKPHYLVYLYGFNLCTKCRADKLEDYSKYIHKHVSRLSVQLFLAKACEDMINDTIHVSQKISSNKGTATGCEDIESNTTPKNEEKFSSTERLEEENLKLNLEKQQSQLIHSTICKLSETDRREFSAYKLAHNTTDEQSSISKTVHSFLNTEIKLLKFDYRIKSSLSLSRAKCDECLKTLDDMRKLKLNALIIKKHPQVVETILNLRKYAGNLRKWKLTVADKKKFMKNAARIRIKASKIYDSFKTLFVIPSGKSFMDVYVEELQIFWKEFRYLNSYERLNLIDDSTFSPSCVFV